MTFREWLLRQDEELLNCEFIGQKHKITCFKKYDIIKLDIKLKQHPKEKSKCECPCHIPNVFTTCMGICCYKESEKE